MTTYSTPNLDKMYVEEHLKLRPSVKKRWLKALRSGEYPQCREAMRYESNEPTAYCCLGVLTDIYVSEQDEYGWNFHPELLQDGDEELPSTDVIKWAFTEGSYEDIDVDVVGCQFQDKAWEVSPTETVASKHKERFDNIEKRTGSYFSSEEAKEQEVKNKTVNIRTLYGLNDLGFDFDQIADIIEEQF